MLVVMESTATPEMVEAVVALLESMGLRAHPIPGEHRTAIGVTGNKTRISNDRLRALKGVQELVHVTAPYKLVGREFHPEDTVVEVAGVKIGGPEIVFIGGPCSVESLDTMLEVAEGIKAAGGRLFRGGAFKPRTSPYSFQGFGEEGLKTLAEVRKRTGLGIVTEAIDPDNLRLVAKYVDMIQIGARNMQNFSLLIEAGRCGKPILLKRGMSSTLTETLMAAEYVLSEGNSQVVICERGVRTFADHTRNTLDLSAVPFIKAKSHLPIIVDPSHGTGVRSMVPSLSLAGVACGADGLIIEAHSRPDEALSDGFQTVELDVFRDIVRQCSQIAPIIGRKGAKCEN